MRVDILLNQIRKRREMLNYSQEYMAGRLNISQKTYSKTELNLSKLTVDRLLQICEILETDVQELFSEQLNREKPVQTRKLKQA